MIVPTLVFLTNLGGKKPQGHNLDDYMSDTFKFKILENIYKM